MLREKKLSISTKILINILSLIGIIFMIILISFNLIVNNYIETSSSQQIESAKRVVSLNNDIAYSNIEPLRPDSLRNYMKMIEATISTAEKESKGEVLLINNNYELAMSIYEEDSFKIDFYEELLKEFESKSIKLDSDDIVRVKTDSSEYYLSFIPIREISNRGNHIEGLLHLYLVIFIDVSDIVSLSNTLNQMLVLIMAIAGVLSVIIAIILSSNISKPIKDLSEFAKRIGNNDFNSYDIEFKEKELDELSKTMNESAKQLEAYDKDQKIFFQNVSHELRTPLMSINGYAEAIKYNILDQESGTNIILEESNRLTEMVESLLYISKIDNITKDYEVVECDLRELLSNCVSRQKIRTINNNIEFVFDFDDREVLFKCDQSSMYRAFSNIIENALRYVENTILITCKYNNSDIIISIENDGDSIEEKDIECIFDRFYKGKKGKHGIGLSIVKSIINEHNGQILAQNTDIGVKFTILLKNNIK